MPDWIARVRQEAAAIASAPIAFLVIILVAGGVMWTVIHLSYTAHIASKNTQIAFLERRLAEWRDRMSGMSPDEARARLAALETQVRTLQQRAQPRSLSNDQRQSLIDRARLRPGLQYTVTILRQEGCSDCEHFAAKIAVALRESTSWSVSTGTLPATADKPRYGVAIRVADPLRPPPEGTRLQDVLQAGGVSFEMIAGGTGAGPELLITERPVQ
jgi:hypothetical protein